MSDDAKSNPLKHLVRVMPFDPEQDHARLTAARAEDAHPEPMFTTHIATRGDEVVGSLSVLTTPLVGFWAHSQKLRPRESMELINFAECIAAERAAYVVVPVASESPFTRVMDRMEFKRMGDTVLYIKKVRN